MALIGKIRKNSWLLIVAIGLGLGGFILMDMMSGQQSVFGSSQTMIADVNGNKLDVNEFTRTEQILYGNTSGDPYARRSTLWNYYVEKYLIEEEAAEIGLGVSKDELIDLQFGTNLSPIITSRFLDPATQQVDRARLNSFRQSIEDGSLDATVRPFWAHQEKEIIQERLKQKMIDMASKGIYVPTWLAEMKGNDNNQKMDMAYVMVPFTSLEDNEVALEDADYQAYIDENKASLDQDEERRRLSYVVFDVIPTAADSAVIYNNVDTLAKDFASTENDTVFVENNFGILNSRYFKESEVAPAIKDTVFDLPIGTVYGPYLEGNAYKATKVIDRKIIPDSVQSRHILISANNQDVLSMQTAYNTIDSLKSLVEAGTHVFDTLALQFGQDATATKGGDLGYAAPGQMVGPFNDYIFFQGEPGELGIVITQFGVHLVEVTGRKYINNDEGVLLATIQEAIIPSEETQRLVEEEALLFIEGHTTIDAMTQGAADNSKLEMNTTNGLLRNDYQILGLGSSQASRDMIRWAFGDDPNLDDPTVGETSPDLYRFQDPVEFYNNKYVVAALKSIQEPGDLSMENLKDEIEADVINKKKGELLKSQMNGKDLAALASQYGVQVDTAKNITFASGFIQNVGAEPKVVASAFNYDLNQTSEPIAGSKGVFVVKPVFKPADTGVANIPQMRSTTARSLQSNVRAFLMESLKKNAEITDNRSRFF